MCVLQGAADGPKDTVIPEPSFRLGAGCMTIAGIGGLGLHSLPIFAPFFVLGSLLLVQATRVRFSFSEDELEVLIKVILLQHLLVLAELFDNRKHIYFHIL